MGSRDAADRQECALSGEMVERVARAQCKERWGRCSCGRGAVNAQLCEEDLRLARAAIEEMREPTREMFGCRL